MIELGAGADEARGPAAAGPAYVRAGKQRAGDAAAPRGGGNLIGCGRVTQNTCRLHQTGFMGRFFFAAIRTVNCAVTSCRVNGGYCNSRKIRSGVPRAIWPDSDSRIVYPSIPSSATMSTC